MSTMRLKGLLRREGRTGSPVCAARSRVVADDGRTERPAINHFVTPSRRLPLIGTSIHGIRIAPDGLSAVIGESISHSSEYRLSGGVPVARLWLAVHLSPQVALWNPDLSSGSWRRDQESRGSRSGPRHGG